MLGHVIENYVTFKDWLERQYSQGMVVIPQDYLLGPPQGSAKVVSGDPQTLTGLPPQAPIKDGWDIAISKSTKTFLNSCISISQAREAAKEARRQKHSVQLDASMAEDLQQL